MIGVVIVTYESEDVIARCLQACTRFSGLNIVVVDNSPTDRTLRQVTAFPSVKVIANPRNVGFAAAVNQGVRECKTEFVLLLNPDTELLDDPERLSRECDGAAGGCLVDASGHPQDGFVVRGFPSAWTLAFESLGLNRLFPANPVNQKYRTRLNHNESSEVDQPAGAFLMIRKEAWAKVGGFDESFSPVWFEDVDFCLRLKRAGYSIRYVPHVKAKHVGGHSAGRLAWESRQRYWYGSLLRYAAKHFSPPGRILVAASVVAGAFLRMSGEVLLHRNLRAVSVYSRVMGFAALSAFSGRSGGLGVPHEFTVNL